VPERNDLHEFNPLGILAEHLNEFGSIFQHGGDVVLRVDLKAA